jgi:hypothetical protein
LLKSHVTIIQKLILKDVVLDLAEEFLDNMSARRGNYKGHQLGMRYTVSTLPKGVEIHVPWKTASELIFENGGTYLFGSSTTKRKWFELTGRPRED